MWIEIIREVTASCQFQPPATSSELADVEQALNLRLPSSLRTLLEETNGIYNTDTQYYEVWSAGEIGYRNQGLRDDSQLAEMYMSFESLLFFASPGVDGIQFAFPITASGTVRDKNIIVWYPIEDSRPVIAMSLKDFLIRWFKGDLVL